MQVSTYKLTKRICKNMQNSCNKHLRKHSASTKNRIFLKNEYMNLYSFCLSKDADFFWHKNCKIGCIPENPYPILTTACTSQPWRIRRPLGRTRCDFFTTIWCVYCKTFSINKQWQAMGSPFLFINFLVIFDMPSSNSRPGIKYILNRITIQSILCSYTKHIRYPDVLSSNSYQIKWRPLYVR